VLIPFENLHRAILSRNQYNLCFSRLFWGYSWIYAKCN
jgi:hypothetical protein